MAAFPIADLVIFGAHRIKSDVEAYCRTAGNSRCARPRVTPFGSDAVRPRGATANPLRPGNRARPVYAMLVSTIEPRKGHELLYRVWKRLLADGIPQARNFKLIFVGRPGWMVEHLLREIAADRDLGDTLKIFSFAADDELAALYANAAFCVYPSLYEGYGLPVVEAFSYGKAVIASTGGAIPEVVGEFSPCLDPKDEESWYRTLRSWIEDPVVARALRGRDPHALPPHDLERGFGQVVRAHRRALPPGRAMTCATKSKRFGPSNR